MDKCTEKVELHNIEEIMEKRGYTYWSENIKDDKVESVFFLPVQINNVDPNQPVIHRPCVEVFLKENLKHEFQFKTTVNPGLIRIMTSPMTPLDDDERFKKSEYYITSLLETLRENGYKV